MNLSLLVRHVFFPRGLENQLDWRERLDIHWQRRWYELTNDAAWFSNGLTTCFLLTGALLPFGIYLAVFMQCYDLINSAVRVHVEITRLCNLRDDYIAMGEDLGDVSEEVDALERRINLERQILYFRVFNFLILFLCVCLTIPSTVLGLYIPNIVVNPIVPLIGTSVSVLITLMTYQMGQSYDAKKDKRYEAPFPNIAGNALLLIDVLPDKNNLKDLYTKLGLFSIGYIRIKNDKGVNVLYYVDKVRKNIILLELDQRELEYVDEILLFSDQLRAISDAKLEEVDQFIKDSIDINSLSSHLSRSISSPGRLIPSAFSHSALARRTGNEQS